MYAGGVQRTPAERAVAIAEQDPDLANSSYV